MNLSEQQKQEIFNLIKSGRKLEAIKHIRKTYGVSLREAKRLADELDAQVDSYDDKSIRRSSSTNTNTKPKGCLRGGCFGGFFALIGLALIVGGISITVYNQQLVTNGELIEATVIEDPYTPVFEYQYNGQTYVHYSNTTSDPPSYYLGEKVEMFINPTNPDDVLVNTFMERWFASVLIGGMGLVFFLVGSIVAFNLRKTKI